MRRDEQASNLENWIPKTNLGKMVQKGEITTIDYIIDNNLIIKEPQITETLMPMLGVDLLDVGQAKGKFGGGQRRPFRVTQKATSDGKTPKFFCFAIVGNKDGVIGYGQGYSKETVPARNKSINNAKKNLFKIKRGCGSWECGCGKPHSIPFEVTGKCSSAEITLFPAPKGLGLCVNDECKKILRMAGITDVWSKTSGQTRSRLNLVKACIDALKQLSKMRLNEKYARNVQVYEGGLK
ncbi:MAG: 30S ribosomal protein S5 [Candidatus Nanoarchaeia archaeon]|nr:30S ribosomal protein S5 [Candidatus Nanoarchaeia archaeon]MDD5054002.1 30S ribosomal protein S5 [Candidatus Nanoarchaeia archaeon]